MPFFIGFSLHYEKWLNCAIASFLFGATSLRPTRISLCQLCVWVVNDINPKTQPQPAGMDSTQASVMRFMPIMFSVLFIFSLLPFVCTLLLIQGCSLFNRVIYINNREHWGLNNGVRCFCVNHTPSQVRHLCFQGYWRWLS